MMLGSKSMVTSLILLLRLYHIKNGGFGLDTDGLLFNHTIFNGNQSRNTHNAKLSGKFRFLIYIDLSNLDFRMFTGNLIHNGREHTTRSAPACPEINQYDLIGMKYFIRKVVFCYG